jgi:hypothetical protein
VVIVRPVADFSVVSFYLYLAAMFKRSSASPTEFSVRTSVNASVNSR